MDTLRKLQQFTINIDDNTINVNKRLDNISHVVDKIETIYKPSANNSLLWCVISMVNGVKQCVDNMGIEFKYETEFKYKQVDLLRDNCQDIKYNGMDPLEVETSFISDKKTSFNALHALCICHKLSVIYLDKNTYINLIYGEDNKHIITNVNGKYTVEYNVSDDRIASTCKHKYHITNIKKPIKGIGSYKVGELRTMCDELGIVTSFTSDGKNKPKIVLYGEIRSYIMV